MDPVKLARAFFLGVGISVPLIGMACATATHNLSEGSGGAASGGGSEAGTGGDAGSGGEGGGSVVPCTGAEDCAILTGSCFEGTCVNGTCAAVAANDGATCDDGLFCTQLDTCAGGVCVGLPKLCPSDDACQVGTCNEATHLCDLAPANDGDSCADGDLCTLTGHCQSGVCQPGPQVDCSFLAGTCGIAGCDAATGCFAIAQNDGATCDDGKFSPCSVGQCGGGACVSIPINENGDCDDFMFNPCSQGKCQAGACVSQPKNEGDLCDDFLFNPCTQGQCQSGSCVSLPKGDGDACEDGLFCTQATTCQGGACTGGQPTDCVPPGGCFIGQCDPMFQQCVSTPGNEGAPCDAMDPCVAATTCAAGACTGGMPANDGATCDDALSCTSGEVCGAGTCASGAGAVVYFVEDFSDNAAGWTLGNEWEIGPTLPSVGGAFGSDPSVDHSPTGDNGVAGVVIGGNASINMHAYAYLTSPAFDTAGAAGQVHLGFYRWLNSDYDPFMHNSVDVWDGAAWKNLWTSGGSPGVQDSPPGGLGWTFITHDVTAYKNAAMKVRFGFDVGSVGVYTIGSWNVDDVRVTSVACP